MRDGRSSTTEKPRYRVTAQPTREPMGGIVQVLSHAIGTDPSRMGDEPGFDITVEDRPPHVRFPIRFTPAG